MLEQDFSSFFAKFLAYLMIFQSFAVPPIHIVFFQEQKKTVHVVRKTICRYYYGSGRWHFHESFFFGRLQYGKSIIFFCLVICMSCVCCDLWLFDKNSSFGRANCFYWSKSWHFWSRCGFLVTTLLWLLHFDRKNKTTEWRKIQSQQIF